MSTIDERRLHAVVLGQVLQGLRERQGITQAHVARAAGVTQSRLSRIESGRAVPDAFELRMLASQLGTSLGELDRRVESVTQRSAQIAPATRDRTPARPWWDETLRAAGMVGLVALVCYAAAEALKGDGE